MFKLNIKFALKNVGVRNKSPPKQLQLSPFLFPSLFVPSVNFGTYNSSTYPLPLILSSQNRIEYDFPNPGVLEV